jgi:hypothetical protein
MLSNGCFKYDSQVVVEDLILPFSCHAQVPLHGYGNISQCNLRVLNHHWDFPIGITDSHAYFCNKINPREPIQCVSFIQDAIGK